MLQSCGAWPLGAVAGYDQHTLSFVSLLSENSAKLITNVTLIPVRPSSQIPLNQVMGTFGRERLSTSQLIAAFVSGIIVSIRGARLCGRSDGGGCRSFSIALTASLSAGASFWRSGRDRGAGRNFLTVARRAASCSRRVAPTFATSNWRPAVCLVRIEVFNRRRGGVVAYGIVRTVEVTWQWRILLRIGKLVVHPLLMLSRLSPGEIVGQGGCGEPIVCVGGLNEAL